LFWNVKKDANCTGEVEDGSGHDSNSSVDKNVKKKVCQHCHQDVFDEGLVLAGSDAWM